MTPVLAALLLAAAAADVPAAETAQPQPEAPAAPPAAATTPPAESDRLPEATQGTQSAKPAVQRLRIPPQESRMDAYQEFRSLYEAGRYDQALPYARRVVELSESDSDRDYELPIAYNNLGATQYQLGDYVAAEGSYRKSLELLEATQGISSRRLVVPLAGLGASFAARDQHEVAAELYDRALAVSRRADGLFNLQQLPLIQQAADSRYAISDYGGAEREYMYALKIAEQNYGYGDPRTLPPLLDMADFYEQLQEFIAARNMFLRARDVALKPGGYDPLAVKALVGIARTHRLQYTMAPDTLESQQPARDEVTGEVVGKVYKESRVPPASADRTGLKSVQAALEMLRSQENPPVDLLTETLIELGDWYQTTSRPNLAMPYYAEAATLFDAQVAADPLAGHPLKAPRMVFYRPPLSARRGLNALSGQYVIRKALFSFAVSEEGEPLDVTVVSSDMENGQLSQSQRAVGKAIYSPRFSDGKAVATAGVTFTSEWYQEYNPEDEADEPAPESVPVATAPEPAEPAGPDEVESNAGG